MRAPKRPGTCSLTLDIAAIFLAVSLSPRFAPRARAADTPAPPLPVPEDPLGQQPEQQTPEITIDGVGGSSWQFNHLLDVTSVSQGLGVREPDGNRAVYVYSTTRWNADQSERWDVYLKGTGGSARPGMPVQGPAKPVGTYSTLEVHYTCVPGIPEGPNAPSPQPTPADQRARRPAPSPASRSPARLTAPECTWDGLYMVFLPKGLVRRFRQNPAPNQVNADPGATPGLIEEERDANGNATTFAWTAFPDQDRAYIASVRDPVGRVTTYGYERAEQVCLNDTCTLYKWTYRVRSITDPWGWTATYTYGAGGLLASAVNGAGRTTGYTYAGFAPPGFLGLTGATNARGYTTTITWQRATLDAPFRVARVTAPDGTATTYAYTASGSRVTRTVVTNARGHATTYDLYAGEDEN
ncbi:MAG: hypothetical protein QN168_07810 [Armatimonadota bacterium]|nr:hypothetical protein [Armatimonadota bacterium]